VYRRNTSSAVIGKFDASLVHALADTTMVRWIAQNGGGYDEIDVQACKERGDVRSQSESTAANLCLHQE
jgi:lactate dehydrogenase-like 2-hydroxyacid dehydrogenase